LQLYLIVRRIVPRIRESTPQNLEESLDINTPNLWPNNIQSVVNKFRRKLQQWTTAFCPVCSRIFSFYRKKNSAMCGHCCEAAKNGKVSKFGAQNDMDPGPVPLVKVKILTLDST
jgi:hypothetical protein